MSGVGPPAFTAIVISRADAGECAAHVAPAFSFLALRYSNALPIVRISNYRFCRCSLLVRLELAGDVITFCITASIWRSLGGSSSSCRVMAMP